MKTTGIVEQVIAKETAKGRKFKVLRLKNFETGFFCWSEELLEGIEKGDQIEIDYSDGEYPRVKKIKKLGHVEEVEEVEAETIKIREDSFTTRREKLRMVALKAAVDSLQYFLRGNEELASTKLICDIASKFEAWLKGEA